MTSRLARLLILTCLVLALPMHAQSRGTPGHRTGEGSIDEVDPTIPWKFLTSDALLHDKAITIYWLPASLKEAERSSLLTSKSLRDATTRCVDLEIVLPEHAATMAKLQPAGKPVTALMVDRNGAVIRTAANVKEIEKMVSAELAARDDAMFSAMTAADQQVRAGNNAAAIELYKKIWDDRCLFTLAGSEAQRALKRLGVTVSEPATGPAQPLPQPSKTGSSPPGHAPGR